MLHQHGDLQRLAHVSLVPHELSRFGRKTDTAPLALRRFSDRLTRSLRAAHATVPRDLVERPEAILT